MNQKKFKVLIVDDEEIIQQGLKKVVPWAELGFTPPDVAWNGKEALEMINQKDYRLLITDIRMPEMDGLELLKHWKELKSDTYFIVLSGYEEFEYAREAIRYGVHHFILKPTDMDELIEILKNTHAEIYQSDQKSQFFDEMKRKIQEDIPLVRNQFIADLIRGRKYADQDLDEFKTIIPWADKEFRLIVLMPGYPESYPGFMTMNILAERIFPKDSIYASTIVRNCNVLLVSSSPEVMLVEKLNRLLKTFAHQQKGELTAIIGSTGRIGELHELYEEARSIQDNRFFSTSDAILSVEEYNQFRKKGSYRVVDQNSVDRLFTLARAGRSEEFREVLKEDLYRKKKEGYRKEFIQTELISLILKISREESNLPLINLSSDIVKISEVPNIDKLIDFVTEVLTPYMRENRQNLKSHRDVLADRMINLIKENLTNPELSLRWISNAKLLANEDYLGKVFKSVTGTNITNYINKLRVDSARELIERYPQLTTGEIAIKAGYPENPQYFFRVFKKILGLTPGEYRKKINEESEE